MTLPAGTLDTLVAGLADEVARRVAAELATAPVPAAPGPWRLVTVEEAAARLTRSTRWVRERAKRGELPFVKLDGGALAFEVADLRAFAEARRVPLNDGPALAVPLAVSRKPAPGAGSRPPGPVGNRRVA
jgi:excisionase family DNA binding protein